MKDSKDRRCADASFAEFQSFQTFQLFQTLTGRLTVTGYLSEKRLDRLERLGLLEP